MSRIENTNNSAAAGLAGRGGGTVCDSPPPPPPVSAAADEFRFVDYAEGGSHNRNHVQRLEHISPNGTPDTFTSHRRGNQELYEFWSNNWRENGHGQKYRSVKGFDGPVWADSLPFDYDCGDDPANALEWLRTTLNRLDSWHVPIDAVRPYLSGAKGFHLEIPHTLFGGFEPSADLSKRMHSRRKRSWGTSPSIRPCTTHSVCGDCPTRPTAKRISTKSR